MFGPTIKTSKILVTIAAASVDPTGYGVVAAGLDTAIHMFDTLASRNPELNQLAKEMDKRLRKDLQNPRFDKPHEARVLLPQMLEKVNLCSEAYAGCDLNASDIFAKLSESIPRNMDYSREHFLAFEDLFLPVLERMCDDPRLTAALKVAITKEQLRRSKDLVDMAKAQAASQLSRDATLKLLATRMGSLENALINPEDLSFKELKALASKFGSREVQSKSDAINYLHSKAQQLELLKAELLQLKATDSRINKIHASAILALSRLDLLEAEELISKAKEDHQENVLGPAIMQNARILESEARVSLLRNDVEQAYRILSLAADSFAVLGPEKPILMRSVFEPLLTNYGLHFDGIGLDYAEKLMLDALKKIEIDTQTNEHQAVKNDLGNIYMLLSNETEGVKAQEYSDLAMNAFKDALRITKHQLTVDDSLGHKYNLAMTSNNMANVIRLQANFEKCSKTRILQIKRAIKMRKSALKIFMPEDFLDEHAMVSRNLLTDYSIMAENHKFGSSVVKQYLDDAFRIGIVVEGHYRRTKEIDELFNVYLDFSIVAMNAYRHFGESNRGHMDTARDLLDSAEALIGADRNPIYWAKVQNNLANWHFINSIGARDPFRSECLRDALGCIEGILKKLNSEVHGVLCENAEEFKRQIVKKM